jgi:hypothetical protein
VDHVKNLGSVQPAGVVHHVEPLIHLVKKEEHSALVRGASSVPVVAGSTQEALVWDLLQRSHLRRRHVVQKRQPHDRLTGIHRPIIFRALEGGVLLLLLKERRRTRVQVGGRMEDIAAEPMLFRRRCRCSFSAAAIIVLQVTVLVILLLVGDALHSCPT